MFLKEEYVVCNFLIFCFFLRNKRKMRIFEI